MLQGGSYQSLVRPVKVDLPKGTGAVVGSRAITTPHHLTTDRGQLTRVARGWRRPLLRSVTAKKRTLNGENAPDGQTDRQTKKRTA